MTDPTKMDEEMEGETEPFQVLEDTLPPPRPQQEKQDNQENEIKTTKEASKQTNTTRQPLEDWNDS